MRLFHALAAEVRPLDTSRRALRSFGLVVGGVLLALGAFALWRRGWALTLLPSALLGVGGTLGVLGLLAPALLRPVYRVWMTLAVVLGFIMTRVLLSVLFMLVITPIGWIRRTVSQSPILTRPNPDAKSYWIPREASDVDDKERLERFY
ncbi:MAG: hypothetical protein HKN04_08585 [Rhodothermaceae bacterium]|nr:hypothetical protein [Rhodothermaceae bacterium]